MTKRIVFATYKDKPLISEDDFTVTPFLAEKNIEIEAKAWDDLTVDWKRFDLVVIRSCWNYHLYPQQFSRWISELEKMNIKVLNPPSVLKWNMNKFYLKELVEKGVSMAKTKWIQKGTPITLSQAMEELKITRAVVKPCIAATAYKTFLVDGNKLDEEEKFYQLLKTDDLMVQEFIPEIQTDGEWSLIFFDKKFSHAVIKRPKRNDFRVQNDFGGTYTEESPDGMILAQAKEILDTVSSFLLYARIDGVVSQGKFLLMELELIEPMLFLNSSKAGQPRFADSIIQSVNN